MTTVNAAAIIARLQTHSKMKLNNRKNSPGIQIDNVAILIVASVFFCAVIIIRLFQLQIIKHDYYQEIATREQYGYTDLPAERGEVIIKDNHSDEEFLLATNTTLNLLYADPSMIKDPQYLGEKLAPLLFSLEDEKIADQERIAELKKNMPQDITAEQQLKLLTPLTDGELEANYKRNLIEKIGEKQRKQILLTTEITSADAKTLKSLNVSGIEVIGNKVYAYPSQISNTATTGEKIADYVKIPSAKLAKLLKGENRYIVLKKKLDPSVSEKIKKMMVDDGKKFFLGLGMQEEYYRFYPEGQVASNIVGYVNKANVGQYGIESSFNNELKGTPGKFQTKKDSLGRQITVGENILEPAVDGDDIVLTIDRSIQLKTETLLKEGVEGFRADSGQAIVMNPQTGAILAMAHYPTYDPNEYGNVFKKIDIELTEEEIKNLVPTKEKNIYYFYRNEVTQDRYLIFEEKDDNGKIHYSRYENFVGPEVYHNKIISWPYEPGSVFKAIVMTIAVDDGDVTPKTTYNDNGPIKVDFNKYTGKYDFEIRNSTGHYGLVDMNEVLAKSLNTGMTFVAKKIGPALFYSYLKKFGFLDRTDIELDSEAIGKIEYFEKWTESELATHAFGQGLTVTVLQMANAMSAIANGGVLMKPFIVDEIRHDDESKVTTEPREIRRIISEETSEKMIAMLVNVIENGFSSPAKVKNHYLAGKSGTSQTYKNGRALSGVGTTIATFGGFGPIEEPQFVIIVKYDHPRSSEWGSDTAAVTFAKLSEYLFDYYNIPPDKKQ